MKVYVCPSARHLAKSSGKIEFGRFIDGEVKVVIKDRPARAVLIGSTHPPSDNLLELALAFDALKRMCKVKVIIPYFAYGRADKKHIGKSLSSAVVSQMFKGKIITIDVHSIRLKKFLRYKDVKPYKLFIPYLPKKNIVVVAPDKGAYRRGNILSRMLRCKSVHMIKKRLPGAVKVRLTGNVKGKTAIIVDDIIAGGGTLAAAARELKKAGAEKVIADVTHAFFAKDALKKLKIVDKILVSDSIPLKKAKNVKVVSLRPLIKELIRQNS